VTVHRSNPAFRNLIARLGSAGRALSGSSLSVQYLIGAGALLALAAISLPFDLPIANYLRVHSPAGDLKRLIMMGEVFGFGLSVALIILTAVVLDSRRLGLPTRPREGQSRKEVGTGVPTYGEGVGTGVPTYSWQIAAHLAVLAYGAGLVANVLKALVGRARPLTRPLEGHVWQTFVGWLPVMSQDWGYAVQSFPSGHTATAVGLAIGLASLYPHGRWLFASFAVLTALQRIVSGAHFVSDTFVGAAVAFFVAALVAHIFANRPRRSLN